MEGGHRSEEVCQSECRMSDLLWSQKGCGCAESMTKREEHMWWEGCGCVEGVAKLKGGHRKGMDVFCPSIEDYILGLLLCVMFCPCCAVIAWSSTTLPTLSRPSLER